jgi:5-methylcytosine-specific restriction enzyme B
MAGMADITAATGTSVADSIAQALASWDRDDADATISEGNGMRQEFLRRFPIDRWPDLRLEDYALGVDTEGGTYCWWLEFKTRLMGSMSGGSSRKHLIWRRKDGTWSYPPAYSSEADAWSKVREGFVDTLALATEGRFDEAGDPPALAGAAALRTKTLYMYFPDAYLPVASKAHLDHFLDTLGEPVNDSSTVEANRHLLRVLRSQPALDGLSNEQLGIFVYHWAGPKSTVQVVKIAPGEGARLWDDCLDGGYICVGWDDVGELTQYADFDAFREAFGAAYPYNGNEAQVTRKAKEVWTLTELEPGDQVVANRGTSEVLAIGTVTDAGYQWRPERSEYRHTVAVTWDLTAARRIEPIKTWATTTVRKVSANELKVINGGATPPSLLSVDEIYEQIDHALDRRGQVILYGPPGTGKTYIARRAAVWRLDGPANPQAAAVLGDDELIRAREDVLGTDRGGGTQVWFMVANPSQWEWKTLQADGSVDFSLGRLQRNYQRVRAGDLVVGYESARTGRVVALARVTGEYDPDGDSAKALTLEAVTGIDNGLTYNELREDPVLADSEPARFRCQGTLFALTTTEADRMLSLLTERDRTVADHASPSLGRLTRVTFHPSYTYEDFVEGYRPQPSASGGLELALTDGIFKQVCAAAAADPDRRHVLVIDEINRGNIPKIFGDLMTLIEKDKRGLTLRLPQSDTVFAVPPNVEIIATMNTADRSIHLLDTALRRRFAFIELLPDNTVLSGITVGPLALDLFLDQLNTRIRPIAGRERQVGHALFFIDGQPVATAADFAEVFRDELLPLLQEYLYEDYRSLAQVLGDRVIDTTAQRPSEIIKDAEALCAALAEELGAAASA